MRCFLIILFFGVSNFSFAQKSKKEKERDNAYQQKIYAYIDSLGKAGSFKSDSIGLNGERIDSIAIFPGGPGAWTSYIRDNFPISILSTANEQAVKCGSYLVWVEFIVNEDGTLRGFRSITNFGFGLEEGFMKYIQNSGTWIPAQSNGKKISSKIKRGQVFEFSCD